MSKAEIDKIGRVKLSGLKELLHAAKEREDNTPLRYDFQLQERNYSAIYSASWSYILFRYVDKDGQTQEKRITLYMESSHLGVGSVIYFVCPS